MFEDLHPEAIETFCNFVEIGDGCWNWIGCTTQLNARNPSNTRPTLHACGKERIFAHIVSWQIKNGPLPTTEAPRLIFRNLCGDTLCVNPDHWKPIATAEDVFWLYVRKGDDPDDCWRWTGHVEATRMGYGRFKFNLTQYRAHRFSYKLHNGLIPKGLMVLHSCHNPSCTNPRHLRIGTQAENVQEMIAAGRNAQGDRVAQKGSQHWKAILNEDQVRLIKSLPHIPRKELAAMFGVTVATIANVRGGRHWKHV